MNVPLALVSQSLSLSLSLADLKMTTLNPEPNTFSKSILAGPSWGFGAWDVA